jgi:hypothetical protein
MTVSDARKLKDLESENTRLKKIVAEQMLAIEGLKAKGLSERAACRIAGVSRRIASYELRQPAKDEEPGAQLIEASSRYPRFGYRRIAVMTNQSIGRVWRLWRSLGLPECWTGLYQAGQPMAERICGKLQRQAARRMPEPGMIRYPPRSEDRDREMAAVL